MARASWKSASLIQKYAHGYRGHRMDRKAIREWTSARLRRQPSHKLRQWVAEEQRNTKAALGLLRGMVGMAKAARATANAQEHHDWLRLVAAEINRQSPPGGANTRGPRSRVRVGVLAREAALHPSKGQRRPE